MRGFVVLILFSTINFCNAQNLPTGGLKSGGQLKTEQAIMDIRHYTIALEVDPKEKSIFGYAEINLILVTRVPQLFFDLWHGLTVSQVWVNGAKEEFVQTKDDLLKIRGVIPFEKGKVHVKIAYGGKPLVAEKPPWVGGFQWTTDGQGNPWIAISCWGEGAKVYFPCKDHPSDEPNEGADLIITVPSGLTVTGPGLLKKITPGKGKDTFHWSTAYTINNYSIVFNVGKYKKVSRPYTTVAGHSVPMDFYVLEEHADKGAHLLELLEKSCHFDEKYYGEYPWVKEKIGVVETPYLGMEHQTQIAYGNNFHYTKLGGQDFDWLLHHEFGHEWWANKVTNKDWAHMWIQEGICSFGDALFTRETEGEQAYLKRMAQTERQIENTKPLVQGDEVDTDETYQGDLYQKGAFFMHTLRYVVGDKVFFPTLKKLATGSRYNYDSLVTTDDVERLFSKESDKPLKSLFDLYLRTTQKIDVHVKSLSDSTFSVWLSNYDGVLPFEIKTETGIVMKQLNSKGVVISGHEWPEIDPKTYYFKRVIQE
jgi:aminopeptidase N